MHSSTLGEGPKLKTGLIAVQAEQKNIKATTAREPLRPVLATELLLQ
jgi:hypothetical protein